MAKLKLRRGEQWQERRLDGAGYCFGKDEPDPPDYRPMANASREAAQLGAELGREQLAESRRQFDDNKAALAPVLNAQLGIMEQSKRQGDDYYSFLSGTFRPLEKQIVADAQDFDTAGKREALARSAVADVSRAQANAEAQSDRAMASMGVNPNSGKFVGLKKSFGLNNAAMRAAAATNARTQAEGLGYARKMDAAGLGRNLPGASSGAYQVATGAGSAAGNTQMAPGQALMAGMAAGNGTIMQGQGLGIQGLGAALSGQAAGANAIAAQNAGAMSGLGALAGAALMASDRRLKENIVRVGVHADTGLPVYEFNYKGDPTRFVGVMADEVEAKYPAAVVHDDLGFASVDYSKLGMELREAA